PTLLHSALDHHHLHSFPTRRSSDLSSYAEKRGPAVPASTLSRCRPTRVTAGTRRRWDRRSHRTHGVTGRSRSSPASAASFRSSRDRKSTRLNSSHVSISYAVFCLKK